MLQSSRIKAEIVLKTKKLGVDLIGVASIERFDHAPHGHKPTDIMIEAKSVIVLAIRCLEGPMKNKHWTSYTMVHEGNDARLNNAAYYLSCFIEEEYMASAIPIPANAPYYHWEQDSQYGAGDLSHKHAAVAAGLGVIGKNSLLITPQYGNKVNLVSVITDLEIEADSPVKRELCPPNCRRCIDACPLQAINDDNTINQAACRNYCWTKLPKGFSVLHCWECRGVCLANKMN
jgi:epoxyqueuosine reductase QueG